MKTTLGKRKPDVCIKGMFQYKIISCQGKKKLVYLGDWVIQVIQKMSQIKKLEG